VTNVAETGKRKVMYAASKSGKGRMAVSWKKAFATFGDARKGRPANGLQGGPPKTMRVEHAQQKPKTPERRRKRKTGNFRPEKEDHRESQTP